MHSQDRRRANILIRTDGSHVMGTGHVMRTLAIAEELIAHGHQVTYCCSTLLEQLKTKISKADCNLQMIGSQISSQSDLNETIDTCRKKNIDCVILDGYGFDEIYLSKLRAIVKLVFIDDELKLKTIDADVIINTSPFATDLDYLKISHSSQLLLGPKYAFIRNEFKHSAISVSKGGIRDHILVTFGGTDPLELTVTVMGRLIELFDETIIFDVVINDGKKHSFPANVNIHQNCNYMATLMKKAGLSLSAGGSTLGELALMQVPTVLVVVADNQEKYAKWAEKNGCNLVIDARQIDNEEAVNIIAVELEKLFNDSDKKQKLINNNTKIVDAFGPERLVNCIEKLIE